MQRLISLAVSALVVAAAPAYIEASPQASSAKKAQSSDAEHVEMSPDEHIAALEAQCAGSAEARAARHTEKPLFVRLGGEEKIEALTREVVRLHLKNEAIKHFFAKLDNEKVASRVAQFITSGTGGPSVYEGPELRVSHAHMKLTNADFLAAGSDVIQAMKNLGYGQNEIDEMVCALVGMRDQVVLAGAEKSGSGKP